MEATFVLAERLTMRDPERELTESAYRVYRSIVGECAPEWVLLTPESKQRWKKAAMWFAGEVENLDGKPWHGITEELHRTFGEDDPRLVQFSALPLQFRLGWEAVVRHLAFVLADAPDNLAEAEAEWVPWAEKRLQEAACTSSSPS